MASPTPAEQTLISQLFNVADPQKLGIITGEAALQAFAGTKLPATTLGEIWAIADSEENGFLTKKTAAVALRLIGHAQKGEPVNPGLVNAPAPLAHIEGISKPNIPPTSSSASKTGGLPQLTSQDNNKFLRIFANAGPVNGLLSGDKARDIFLKSKLPYEKLAQIWSLADTHNRGALDSSDFSVAMYFVQACMSNSALVLPQTLPPSVYEQAGGKATPVVAHSTGGSTGLPPQSLNSSFTSSMQHSQIKPQYTGGMTSKIAPQYTGQSVQPQYTGQRPPAPAPPRPAAFPNAFRPPVAPFWDVSPSEKAVADGHFATLDPQNRGHIDGEIAGPFLLQSGLSGDILAQVWDLADYKKDGQLTKDTFAVAMHLVNGKLAGQNLPDELPSTLIPPSLRQPQPQSTPTASAFKPAPVSEIHRDLFDLDNSMSTSASSSDPFGPPKAGILQPQSTGPPASAAAPLQPQFTANRYGVATPPPSARQVSSPLRAPEPARDLLGDDEESATENATIHANAAEIGNLHNQISSTQRSLKSTQEERKTLEETVAAQASQLSSLQSQLTTAKAAYETERKLLSNLQERMTAQNADIQKTREELIRGESDLSALKIQKSEVEGSVLHDKEEIRDLQRRMKETNEGTETLKAEVEKGKKDARQQKGLLAIAKKQLATSEADREKVEKELQEAKLELEQLHQEIEETQQQVQTHTEATRISRTELANSKPTSPISAISKAASPISAEVAAQVHIPDTPDISTPLSVSSVKSTNPFDKLKFGAGGKGSPTGSPFQPFPAVLPNIEPEIAQKQQPSVDPFGIGEDSVESPQSKAAASQPVSNFDDEFMARSPDTGGDEPPSATLTSPDVSKVENMFPSLDGENNREIGPKVTSNDELAPVKDIEPEDDSGSSDDEEEIFHDAKAARSPGTDEKPLAKELLGESEFVLVPKHDMAAVPNGNAIPEDKAAAISAFDDAFGEATTSTPEAQMTPTPSQISPASQPQLAPSPVRSQSLSSNTAVSQTPFAPFEPPAENHMPPPGIETVLDPIPKPSVAGVSAFDEAMSGLTKPTPVIQTSKAATDLSHMGFESNFDDTFDFSAINFDSANGTPTQGSAINGATPMPAPAPAPALAPAAPPVTLPSFPVPDTSGSLGFLPPIKSENAALSFDDAFGNNVPTEQQNGMGSDISHGATSNGAAFDDAFGLSQSGAKPTSPKPILENAGNIGRVRTPSPIPTVSPPLSPNRTMSSRRSVSPPARPSSPMTKMARRKSSSSKITQPEEKRGTKLSLRFPFGKKNKDKDKEKDKAGSSSSKRFAPPSGAPPVEHLAPVIEPSGTRTPAVDDDTDALKALCSMGFSRSQALDALERHNFDMSKALNSLLGTTS